MACQSARVSAPNRKVFDEVAGLATEPRNPRTMDLDRLATRAVLERINAEVRKIVAQKDMEKILHENGVFPAGGGTPEQLQELIRKDFVWTVVERSKGEYDFSAYDRLLDSLDARGIRALFILDYRNTVLKLIRPGVTTKAILEDARLAMEPVLLRTKFSKPIYEQAARKMVTTGGGILSHPVGMAGHDDGPYNRDVLKDPNSLRPGTKLMLPD